MPTINKPSKGRLEKVQAPKLSYKEIRNFFGNAVRAATFATIVLSAAPAQAAEPQVRKDLPTPAQASKMVDRSVPGASEWLKAIGKCDRFGEGLLDGDISQDEYNETCGKGVLSATPPKKRVIKPPKEDKSKENPCIPLWTAIKPENVDSCEEADEAKEAIVDAGCSFGPQSTARYEAARKKYECDKEDTESGSENTDNEPEKEEDGEWPWYYYAILTSLGLAGAGYGGLRGAAEYYKKLATEMIERNETLAEELNVPMPKNRPTVEYVNSIQNKNPIELINDYRSIYMQQMDAWNQLDSIYENHINPEIE